MKGEGGGMLTVSMLAGNFGLERGAVMGGSLLEESQLQQLPSREEGAEVGEGLSEGGAEEVTEAMEVGG